MQTQNDAISTERMRELALARGFSRAAFLDAPPIKVEQQVRDLCAANTCRMYGTNWGCPPGNGSLAECGERIAQYARGMLVQTIVPLEDSYDFEGMEEGGARHKENFAALRAELMAGGMTDILALSAGGCRKCAKCTYPEEPCRFPEDLISSVEGYGMLVPQLCKLADVPYINGANTVTYVGLVLFDRVG